MSAALKTRARRKAERPSEILKAAFEEFSQHGFAATRLEDVARRAGVTKGTVYVYFPDKETLFLELLRDLIRPVAADIAAFAQADGSTVDFLRSHIRMSYQALVGEARGRETLRLLISESRRFPALTQQFFNETMEPTLGALKAILERGVARGELRASAVLQYPEVVIAPALAFNVFEVLFESWRAADVNAYMEAHLDLILEGLLPEKTHPRKPRQK